MCLPSQAVSPLLRDIPATKLGRGVDEAGHPNHGNGVDVLIANMNIHGAYALNSKRGGHETKINKKGRLVGAGVLFMNPDESCNDVDISVNAVNHYFILLRCLSQHSLRVREQFSAWEHPEDAATVVFACCHTLTKEDRQHLLYKPHHVRAEIEACTQMIEVLREGQLETIHFPVPRACMAQMDSPFVRDFLEELEEGLVLGWNVDMKK